MKGKFWNPDRKFFSRKFEIAPHIVGKSSKDWKKITEKRLFFKNAFRDEKAGLTTLF